MEVKILTPKQQKQTLSGKKLAKKKISARNTLSTPYSPYWPVVSFEKEAELECTLNKLLPLIKRSRQHIPLSELRKLTKEQRLDKRKHSSSNEIPELSTAAVLGVNAVSRALEKGVLCCALVAGDVQPRILVSHLALLSAVRAIPLVVLSSLRHVSRAALGFSCIALGVKKNVADDKLHQFHPLLEVITRQWSSVPQPEPLVGFLSTPDIDVPPEDSSCSEHETDDSVVKVEDLYLPRTSTKKRVFVPSDDRQPSQAAALSTVLCLQQSEPHIHFSHLKIKRIRSNAKKIRK